MFDKLEGYTRHVVGNRRDDSRKRVHYEVTLRDEATEEEIFRGKSKDLSESGIRVFGLPQNKGVRDGQRVIVEVLLLPRDTSQIAKRPTYKGYIVRLIEDEAGTTVCIAFDRGHG